MSAAALRHLAFHLRQKRIPGQVVIQYTDRCNARCPQCGMRATEAFSRSTLSREAVLRILDAAGRRRVGAVSFTGGEPMLYLTEIADLIRHAGAVGIPYIRTGTNGFFFREPNRNGFRDRIRRVADTLAATPLRNLWISIDSAVPQVHERMRGFPGVIEGIRRALPEFHARGIYPSANLGINRNIGGEATRRLAPAAFASPAAYLDAFYRTYRKAFREFYGFVADLGFTMVNTCYPMSIGSDETGDGLSAVYAATAVSGIVRFTAPEKVQLFRALRHTIPEFRPRLRIFSPLTSLLALERQYRGAGPAPFSCRGGIDFFFIDARDGNAYPCGYRGDDRVGPYWAMTPPNGSGATECTRCDWECFRDPSELFGPLLEGLSRPAAALARLHRDRPYRAVWLDDLRYYRVCGMFDGRQPPDRRRMARFRPLAS